MLDPGSSLLDMVVSQISEEKRKRRERVSVQSGCRVIGFGGGAAVESSDFGDG